MIAGPIFAATGSRLRAIGMSFASGMSEPLGALVAVALVRLGGAKVDAEALHMLLAAVGGLMGAVCVINLLPEASQYNAPVHKWGGVVVGALLIAAVGALLEE